MKIIFVFLSTILASSASIDDSLAIVKSSRAPILQPKSPELQKQQDLQKSFAAQIADLRLVDDLFMTFDITGLRGLEWELTRFLETKCRAKTYESIEDVINPYFFRVTKNDRSFFLLGSIHILSLDILPIYVKKTILNCTIFVTERDANESEEEFQSMDLKERLKQSFSSWYDPQATWFDSLTEREKKYFQNISPNLNPEEFTSIKDVVAQVMEELGLTSLGIEKVKTARIFDAFHVLHYGNGMDTFLQQFFSSRTRKSLETAQEGRDSEGLIEMLGSSEDDNSEDDDDLLDSLGSKGFLMSPDIIYTAKSYLLGELDILQEEHASYPRISRDNARWYPRLIKFANEASSEELVCAMGALHLGGSGGVLYRLLTEGGYTATRYNSRDGWSPVNPSDLL